MGESKNWKLGVAAEDDDDDDDTVSPWDPSKTVLGVV